MEQWTRGPGEFNPGLFLLLHNNKAALTGAAGKTILMNRPKLSTDNRNLQAHRPGYEPPVPDPWKDAKLHNSALRLDLRRLRRNLVGGQKVSVVNRLLDANAAVARSLDWLGGTGDPCATCAAGDDLAKLGQFDPLAGDAAPSHVALGVSQ